MGGSITGLSAPDHHLCLLPCLCGAEGLGLGHFAATDGITLAAALQATWDEEAQALFAAVMSFWFGSRQISKMRRGG